MTAHALTDEERKDGFVIDPEISDLDPAKPVVIHVLDNQGNELVQFAEHKKGLIHVHNGIKNRLDGLTQGYDALDCNKPINIEHIGNNHLAIQGTPNPDFEPVSPDETADIIRKMINRNPI